MRQGDQPIWNEAIVFDITNPNELIVVELTDTKRNATILHHEISLKDSRLLDFAEQGREIWAYEKYDFED